MYVYCRTGVSKVFAVRAKYRTISHGPSHYNKHSVNYNLLCGFLALLYDVSCIARNGNHDAVLWTLSGISSTFARNCQCTQTCLIYNYTFIIYAGQFKLDGGPHLARRP